MRPIAVAFAGRMGSGKSASAQPLADALGCQCASFGGYVRRLARTKGLRDARSVLQSLGDSLIREDCRRFCEAVLAEAGWQPGSSLVIDGIRHLEVLELLRTILAPTELVLVMVTVPESIRLRRLRERGLDDGEELAALEDHPTEAQVRDALPQAADLTVDGTKDAEELAAEIVGWLGRQQPLL